MSTENPFAEIDSPKSPSRTPPVQEPEPALSTQPTEVIDPPVVSALSVSKSISTASTSTTSTMPAGDFDFKKAFNTLREANADFMKNIYSRYFGMDPLFNMTEDETKALGRRIIECLYNCYVETSKELTKMPNQESELLQEFIAKNQLSHSDTRIKLQASTHMMNINGVEVPNVRLKGTLFNVRNAIVVIDIAGAANNGFIYLTPIQATYVECLIYNIRHAVTHKQVVMPPSTVGKNSRNWGKPKQWTSAKGHVNYIANMDLIKKKIAALKQVDETAGNTPKTNKEYLETFAVTRTNPQFPHWKVPDPKNAKETKDGRWIRVKIRPNPEFKLQLGETGDPIPLTDADRTLFIGNPVAMLIPHIGVTAGSPFDMKLKEGQVAQVGKLKAISLVGYLSGTGKVYSLSSAVKVKLDDTESFF